MRGAEGGRERALGEADQRWAFFMRGESWGTTEISHAGGPMEAEGVDGALIEVARHGGLEDSTVLTHAPQL